MRLLCLCLLSSFSIAESAFAGINYAASGGSPNWQPSNYQQTSSYLHYEMYDAGGAPINSYDCPATFTCAPDNTPPYTTYTVTLVLDDQREEVVSSVCAGELGTATTCNTKQLNATLRIKTGPLKLTPTGADHGRPTLSGFGTGRFRWGTDKYWDYTIAGQTKFPVGQYTIEVLTPPGGECELTAVDSAMTVTVTTDGVGVNPVDFLWSASVCEWYFHNDSTVYGGTLTSSDGQSCAFPPNAECYFNLPFDYDTQLRMSGYGDGTKPYYRFPGSSCSGATGTDHTICDLFIRGEGSVDVEFVAVEAGPPVLTASAGPATPATKSADKGAEQVVVQQVHLAPTTNQPSLTSIAVTATGGHPDADFTAVKAIRDVNSNGIFDGTDTILGSATFDDAGQATITLDSALLVASGTDIAIAVDINTELAAGASLPGSPWSLLFVVLIPVLVLARRNRAAVTLALCIIVASCGGGSGGTDEDTDADQQSDTDITGDTDGGNDDDQPIDSVTFTFNVSGATIAVGTVAGLPITGGSLTVAR